MIAVDSLSASTHRTTRFEYEKVTPELVLAVHELASAGASAVLLGPSGSGKQLVVAEIEHRLRSPECFCVRICGETFAETPSDRFHSAIGEMLREQIEGFPFRDGDDPESWRQPLRRLLEAQPVRVVFLVSNVDALPAFLARSLLKSFRELTDIGGSCAGRFSVLLTGAADLAPLVYGADSEFYVRDQYVIQGFGVEKFVEFYLAYAKAASLKTNRECGEFVFSKVGGHLALLRLVVEHLLDMRRAACKTVDELVTVDEVKQVLMDVGERRALFGDIMLRPLSRLEASPSYLRMLETLIQEGDCPIPQEMPEDFGPHSINPPTALELAGVAKRKADLLVWASELARTLTLQYFNDWVLGDCYACGNQWKDAIRCYCRARSSKKNAEASSTLRPRLQAAHRSFEAALFRKAGDGEAPVAKLREFFVAGARAVLGFDEATFWQFNDEKRDWERVLVERRRATVKRRPPQNRDEKVIMEAPEETSINRIRSMLPAPEQLSEGINPIGAAEAPFAMMTRLPEFKGRPVECVILSCLGSANPLTRERRRATSAVQTAFGEAYQQARKNQLRAKRASLQQILLRAIPTVLRLLAGRPERTRQALQAVGEELRANWCRRVMFSITITRVERLRVSWIVAPRVSQTWRPCLFGILMCHSIATGNHCLKMFSNNALPTNKR